MFRFLGVILCTPLVLLFYKKSKYLYGLSYLFFRKIRRKMKKNVSCKKVHVKKTDEVSHDTKIVCGNCDEGMPPQL